MKIRAKFTVQGVIKQLTNNDVSSVELVMLPVTSGSEENKSFSKYTPNGKIEMSITNPALFDAILYGDSYYVDFTKVEE